MQGTKQLERLSSFTFLSFTLLVGLGQRFECVWMPAPRSNLHASLLAVPIEQSARADRIGNVLSGQQRDATDKHTTIGVLDCGLRLRCIWKGLRVR